MDVSSHGLGALPLGTFCILWVWIVAAGLFLFLLMGFDKRRARQQVPGHRRVWESTLLTWGIMGGAVGGWIAMHVFRHKTRHLRFRILYPLLSVLWIGVAWHLC